MGNDYILVDYGFNVTLYDLYFKELMEPERIGTFLHYALYYILQSGFHQNKLSLSSSLSNLMAIRKGTLDLTLITKMFGMNDFKNTELLEDYELENDHVSLNNVKECFNAIETEHSLHEFERFNEKKVDKSYKLPSPCLNLTGHSSCKTFCEWHKNVTENWPSNKIDTLERYT